MKTLLKSLLIIPLTLAAVGCDEAASAQELDARAAAAEFDFAEEDLDDTEDADAGDFLPDDYDLRIEDPPPTHNGADINDLTIPFGGDPEDIDDVTNGPDPTHDDDVDEFHSEPDPVGHPDPDPTDWT